MFVGHYRELICWYTGWLLSREMVKLGILIVFVKYTANAPIVSCFMKHTHGDDAWNPGILYCCVTHL